MIDEKKIEEAAVEQLENLGTYGLDEVDLGKEQLVALYREEDVKAMFWAGINRFKENLWHDASEKPEAFVYILAEIEEFHKGYKVLMFHGGDPWEKLVKYNGITRWLYIEDLMKGGK